MFLFFVHRVSEPVDVATDVWFMLALSNINIYLYSSSKLTETD